jgi:hypothetical protein
MESNNKKCIFFSSNSLIDLSVESAAKARGYEYIKVSAKDAAENEFSFKERQNNFQMCLKEKNLEDLINSRLIYAPNLKADNEKLVLKSQATLSTLLNPLALSLAYSSLCRKASDNRIIFIGSVKGYDFLKIDFDQASNSLDNILSKLADQTHSTQLDGSLSSTTKFLALNLAELDIKVNAAMFGPIKDVDNEEIIEAYRKKSISGIPVKMQDISDSLDLFIDPFNTYMTGQVLKFDGGVSIW